MEPAPVVATVNYQLQPVICFNGKNWSIFNAAFTNYARQQGFYTMLGDEGANEPNENGDRWRQRMAQATTALTSGWVANNILSAFKHETDDNAHTIWRRLNAHYAHVTDVRQLSLRDRAERYKQSDKEPIMDFLGALNSRVADLAASGQQCDCTYRKQLVRWNCNARYKNLVQQILLINPRQTYEEFTLALLEASADADDFGHAQSNGGAYFSQSNRSRGGRSRHSNSSNRGGATSNFQRGHGGRNAHQHNFSGRNNSGVSFSQGHARNGHRGGGQRNAGGCHACGGRGHIARDCANNQRGNNFRHRAHHSQESNSFISQNTNNTPDFFGRAFVAMQTDYSQSEYDNYDPRLSNYVDDYVMSGAIRQRAQSFSSVLTISTISELGYNSGTESNADDDGTVSLLSDDSLDEILYAAAFSDSESDSESDGNYVYPSDDDLPILDSDDQIHSDTRCSNILL